MKANFDFVAPYYDRLSTMVFGQSMTKAQTIFLSQISQEANVLVLGGGTGWLLAELLRINPTCKVWYIEASARMLELTASRIGESAQVTFIHGSQEAIPSEIRYDAVVTHFFFDLFGETELAYVIPKIAGHLHSRSIWLVSDFVKARWWHGPLINMMYAFFYVVADLSTVKLSDWRAVLLKNDFSEVKRNAFFKDLIVSGVWVKLPTKKD